MFSACEHENEHIREAGVHLLGSVSEFADEMMHSYAQQCYTTFKSVFFVEF